MSEAQKLRQWVAETNAWVAQELAKIEVGERPEDVIFESDEAFESHAEARRFCLQVRTVIECEVGLLDHSENAEYLQYETVRGHCAQKYFDYKNAVERLAKATAAISEQLREFDGTEISDEALKNANWRRRMAGEQLDIARERLRAAMSAYRRVVRVMLAHDDMERPKWSWISAEWHPAAQGRKASKMRRVTASAEEAARYTRRRAA